MRQCVKLLARTWRVRVQRRAGDAGCFWRKKQCSFGIYWIRILYPKMSSVRIACLLLALARTASAQTSNQSVSPAAAAVILSFGAAGGLILMTLLISYAWKRYKVWQTESVVNREQVVGQLSWSIAAGTIPFSDIEFQGADLCRLLHNDNVQTTPRSIDKKESKRYSQRSRAIWDNTDVLATTCNLSNRQH